ncbi:hypothetical protein BESB_069340 [Besnoitia besnoiti]|uniref:Uncharacterized protein n=1 Tax=Besnoitia besnoiti TaxID=94643 RepID=A0A2A9MF64_BESBE|nr:hypothetical protein BESB_069340 [Besnoitia besnoiti]PFH34901.1 hypothetical protein BESB_069340 [Besnoitia besnoiti]
MADGRGEPLGGAYSPANPDAAGTPAALHSCGSVSSLAGAYAPPLACESRSPADISGAGGRVEDSLKHLAGVPASSLAAEETVASSGVESRLSCQVMPSSCVLKLVGDSPASLYSTCLSRHLSSPPASTTIQTPAVAPSACPCYVFSSGASRAAPSRAEREENFEVAASARTSDTVAPAVSCLTWEGILQRGVAAAAPEPCMADSPASRLLQFYAFLVDPLSRSAAAPKGGHAAQIADPVVGAASGDDATSNTWTNAAEGVDRARQLPQINGEGLLASGGSGAANTRGQMCHDCRLSREMALRANDALGGEVPSRRAGSAGSGASASVQDAELFEGSSQRDAGQESGRVFEQEHEALEDDEGALVRTGADLGSKATGQGQLSQVSGSFTRCSFARGTFAKVGVRLPGAQGLVVLWVWGRGFRVKSEMFAAYLEDKEAPEVIEGAVAVAAGLTKDQAAPFPGDPGMRKQLRNAWLVLLQDVGRETTVVVMVVWLRLRKIF